ncbi:hypothetical protein [Lentzea aerocolonigenes]|uniref:hypothetical protein n=1 Tax=Lentzea aerocolonigenes TaxID=68170 RepID=UPI0012E1191B|nr:hypothetical protein [Lentzea aerocolonigenes]
MDPLIAVLGQVSAAAVGAGLGSIRHLAFKVRPLPRVRANFNALTQDGLIRVRVADFSVLPQQGARVLVFEPDDEVEGFARVSHINANTGLAYLDVAWDTLKDTEVVEVVDTCPAPEHQGSVVRNSQPYGIVTTSTVTV